MTSPVNRLLARILRANLLSGAAYLAVSVVDSVTAILVPATLAAVVDAALGRAASSAPLVLMAVLLVLATGAEAARELIGVRTSTKAGARLRHLLVGHVLRLDGSSRNRFPAGDLLTRLVEGTAETARLVPVVVGTVVSALTSVAGVVALFVIDHRVGLVFVLGAPVVWLLARGFFRRTAELTTEYQQHQGKLATRMVDALSGVRSIRATGTVEQEIGRVLAPLPALRAHGVRFWLAQRDMGWRLALVGPALQIGALATAGYGVSTGTVTPGGLIAITGYLGFAMGIFRQASVLAQFGRVRGSADRLAEVLSAPASKSGQARFPDGGGVVTIEGVRVLDGDRVVLDGVDLKIPAGSSAAVVGRSGVGKSALAAVVGGLRTPDSGRVLVDGVDLADADPDELREVVACAFERPVLLGRTVRDAVAYGDRGVAAAAVSDALRDSSSASFVARLPDRELTRTADLRLSGGESQRLGLARAFCREPRVLVLDDALSSVDTVTEARISLALERRHWTRLVVAHRMSTAARADRVIWLDDGRVAAVGTHQDLLARRGYRELFGHQDEDVDVEVPA
ncbi:ABC transporter ATP-binding protein [Amycolatopsis kentuckyensis]|uniref:ABC transporter ATP-binding protein n=1 Tax=Amycolatopsis kentuckyensis TaxID=218823 RepID=UPI000A38132F|nr:ABC transporter ATP-binding protein [Amycolatopsis kentuckyensis]